MSGASVLISASVGALTAFAAVLAIVLIGRMQWAEDALALGTAGPKAAGPGRSPWAVPLLSALGIVGVLVIAAGVATSPDYSGTWARYAADDDGFSVEMPGTPTVRTAKGARFHELNRGVSVLQIGTVDLGADLITRSYLDQVAVEWLEELEELEILEPTLVTSLDGQPARRVHYVDTDGNEWTQILGGVGHRMVLVSEMSYIRGSRSELDRVPETFRFTGDEPPAEAPSEPELARILPG
jgi:hypothetical protein